MNATAVIALVRERRKSCILLLALLLMNLGLWGYAATYQLPRLEKLQSHWFAKRKSATVAASRDISAVYRQGESDLKQWRARIIPKRDFARFVGNLFETAAKNSLQFKSVTYRSDQVKGQEDLVTYTLDFNVAGKYGAVKSFLADLGRRREILTIDNIALANSQSEKDAIALHVQLTVYLRMVD